MQAETLRFRLCVPAIELGGVDALLGRPVQELLAPVLEGEPTLRTRDGLREQVWPLCVKPGQGFHVDLRMLGKYEVCNDSGSLRLTAPGFQAMLLKPLLFAYLGDRLDASATLAQTYFWLALPEHGILEVPVGKGFWVRVERG